MEFVYRPSDDSSQTLDVSTSILRSICENKDKVSLVEVGSGSGYVIGQLVEELARINCRYGMIIGIDINPHAARLTSLASDFIDSIRSDLLSPLRSMKVDLVIFNLPYLLGPRRLGDVDWIDASIYINYLRDDLMDAFLRQVKGLNVEFTVITYSSESMDLVETAVKSEGFTIMRKVVKHVFFEDIITSILRLTR